MPTWRVAVDCIVYFPRVGITEWVRVRVHQDDDVACAWRTNHRQTFHASPEREAKDAPHRQSAKNKMSTSAGKWAPSNYYDKLPSPRQQGGRNARMQGRRMMLRTTPLGKCGSAG